MAGGGTIERCEEHPCCFRAPGILAAPGYEHLAGGRRRAVGEAL